MFRQLKAAIMYHSTEKWTGFIYESSCSEFVPRSRKTFLHLQPRWFLVSHCDFPDSSSEKKDPLLQKKTFFVSLGIDTLSGEHVSAEDYEHAKNMWSTFKIKSLGEYHDLFVASDVLLLADVFENFRKICLKNYELDPAHITSPSLAWQTRLKMSQQLLELFTSIDMRLFIEKGIRGGISTICKKYARANKRHLENYNSSSPFKYMIYFDANNLYGWAMSKVLPYGDFKWISPDTFNKEQILSIPENSEVGYVFEVDLDYPTELHNLHSHYPLAPQKLFIKKHT
ncbi:protein NYNRIN [Trichonephila clavipes]|nr:protein NYNRIN [Trichonephila clavipes]